MASLRPPTNFWMARVVMYQRSNGRRVSFHYMSVYTARR